ncbi:hypothetical protein [Tenacibaculum finnmarkense]|uniref:hypothetical protein n=1 Tax=Tenacibaculum finnmarkense TaxID=2781243 RepID=UPI001E39C62A|nr:hypothetical protein [Tenacibaculum finnmarkense]MCD8423628.1 hypothetical protein [Tenacibaculum finnmarkense genomovar ulcerans]MCG8239761.1 hypothetical protein [Tenacibaculum finnmarkense genomovar ulcerans]
MCQEKFNIKIPNIIALVLLDKENPDLKDIQKYIESKGYLVSQTPSDDIEKSLLVIE